MTKYWFKPHAYGYGATPIGWRGWAAVLGHLAVVFALAVSLAALPAGLPEGPGTWQAATFVLMVAALTWWFIRFCRARTDGQWAWRWGKQR